MRVRFQIKFIQNELSFFLSHEKAENHEFISMENDNIKFFLKGILLNLNELKKNHPNSNDNIIQQLYFKYDENFTKAFRGEFSGFLWDKKRKKLFVFTNLIGSQRVYYYQNKKDVLVDSDLFHLKEELKTNNLPYSLDKTSVYSILSLTNLLDHHTLISEVKKLRGGEQLQIDILSDKVNIKSINSLINHSVFQGKKKDALAVLDSLFSEAIKLEFQFDQSIHKKHFSLLSGGLDSRMGVFYAKKLGFTPDESLCFSHSNYWDEIIAQQIADDLNLPLRVVHLNNGEFLKSIDSITAITQGLTPYLSAVHSNFALNKIDFSDKGLIHSGHLGDAILGTYLSKPKRTSSMNGISRMISNPKYIEKVQNTLIEESKKYETEELFLLHNRGFNLISSGIYVAEKYSYQTSPFMHDEFIRFSLSLPENWKFNQKIYIEWINQYCKESTNYLWERTLMKPNKIWKTEFGLKFKKRFNSLLYSKLTDKQYKINMAPYQYYINSNLTLNQYFEKYFNEHIDLINDQDLKMDLINTFTQSSFKDKASVLTVLGGYKYLFE